MLLTQQQAVTVIWMVFRPARQTSFSGRGRCKNRWSGGAPGGPGLWIMSGVAFTLTATEIGQFVAICESSWWKHFNCNSRSGLLYTHTQSQPIFARESRMLRASLPSSGRPSVCPSVRLSVRPSVTLVSCIKTVQARVTKSLLWATPRSLVYRDKISCH